MQPGEREIEQSSVQRNAVQSAHSAQHRDKRLCLQIHFLETSGHIYSLLQSGLSSHLEEQIFLHLFCEKNSV